MVTSVRTRILVLFAVSAWAAAAPGSEALDPRAQHGANLLQPFKRDLQAALQQGLAQGPAAAIDACRIQAPRIAAGLSRAGVRLGRSSHRLRNPANEPPSWVVPLLDGYKDEPGDRAPRLVAAGPDRTGYAEPIYIQPKCLLCHGSELAPPVAVKLEVLYPEDRATGFQAGDFRGVFWVEFPTPR